MDFFFLSFFLSRPLSVRIGSSSKRAFALLGVLPLIALLLESSCTVACRHLHQQHKTREEDMPRGEEEEMEREKRRLVKERKKSTPQQRRQRFRARETKLSTLSCFFFFSVSLLLFAFLSLCLFFFFSPCLSLCWRVQKVSLSRKSLGHRIDLSSVDFLHLDVLANEDRR